MRRCVMCKQEKPLEAFAFRSKATGERQSHCRSCHKAYRREHYLRNRDTYIKREVDRIRRYRAENRIRLFDYLSEHPCVDCGETDVLVLEFDHRDPAMKRREVPYIAARKPWKFVEAEIAKCDVRCANCHRLRTAVQFRWRENDLATETQRNARPDVHPTEVSGESRTCSACGLTKPIEKFSIKNHKTGRRATRCHGCVAGRSREHYRENKADYIARGRRNKRAHRGRNRANLGELLEGKSCVDCGRGDPLVLEFDHRDGVKKESEVGRLVATKHWSEVAAEVAKCDIRCANCHRRRTARQFGWIKLALRVERSIEATMQDYNAVTRE